MVVVKNYTHSIVKSYFFYTNTCFKLLLPLYKLNVKSNIKKLEIFGGHLFSEDDHLHWAPPYWNIMKEISPLGRTEV